VAYFRGFVAHLWRGNPVIVLLAVAGLAAVIAETIRRRGGAGFTVPLVALLYAPIVGVTAPYVTPAFQNGRYLGAPVAAAVVLAACGAAWIVERGANQKAVGVEQRARARGPGPARKALAWLVALLVLFNVVTTGIATAANTAGAESSINRMQVALGKWLARNTPPQAVIACNDVGAIGYFAKRRVLDLLGLVTPEVVLYRNRQPVKREYLGAMEFVQDKKPDYLVIFPDWFPNARTAKFLQPVHVVDLPDNTASQWYFEPVVQTRVGILITGLEIRPRRSMTVVYRCDLTQNPP
jgi:hypothetical protein